MRFYCLVCLLLAGLAYGQAAQPATPPAAGAQAEQGAPATPDKAPAAPEVKVAPDDVVITLKGFCADSSLQGDACKTVITRAQFEKLAEALQPGMAQPMRRQLATRYSWIVKMSAAAEKRGLDKDPSFDEKMRYARMQILAQALGGALQEDSQKVSDADVADYYKKNEATYEQATFVRIFVPRTKQQVINPPPPQPKVGTGTGIGAKAAPPKTTAPPAPPKPPTDAQKKAAEDAMTKLAASIRERLVQGEDPDKLQKEAFAAAGLPGNATNTKVEKVRRNTLPAPHQSVMDLQVGDVSQVITDANSGHYIYKLVSKETVSLETATPEIRKNISSQRYRDSMQGYQGDIDLSDAYFGAVRVPANGPRPGGLMKPPDQPAQKPQ
jgi:hypothetical protein